MGTAKVKHGDSDLVSGVVFQEDKIQPRHITAGRSKPRARYDVCQTTQEGTKRSVTKEHSGVH